MSGDLVTGVLIIPFDLRYFDDFQEILFSSLLAARMSNDDGIILDTLDTIGEELTEAGLPEARVKEILSHLYDKISDCYSNVEMYLLHHIPRLRVAEYLDVQQFSIDSTRISYAYRRSDLG